MGSFLSIIPTGLYDILLDFMCSLTSVGEVRFIYRNMIIILNINLKEKYIFRL
jgi:hypothetical protein